MIPIVHGDKTALVALHDRIERTFGWTAVFPHRLERVRFD